MFKKRRGEFEKPTLFSFGKFGDGTFAYSGARIQNRFYPGDCVTSTGDREIRSVSGRVGMNVFGDQGNGAKKFSGSREHELKTFFGTRGFINGEQGIQSKNIKES